MKSWLQKFGNNRKEYLVSTSSELARCITNETERNADEDTITLIIPEGISVDEVLNNIFEGENIEIDRSTKGKITINANQLFSTVE